MAAIGSRTFGEALAQALAKKGFSDKRGIAEWGVSKRAFYQYKFDKWMPGPDKRESARQNLGVEWPEVDEEAGAPSESGSQEPRSFLITAETTIIVRPSNGTKATFEVDIEKGKAKVTEV